jgi:hypothetical protein
MTVTKKKTQFWIVGATWDDDQYQTFIDRGYWEMGYTDDEKPKYAERRNQMKAGDRIAIKSRLGIGSPKIKIRAIGVIKEIDENGRVYVDWVVKDLSRKVASKGCYGTIHRPYNIVDDADWIGRVFRI